tara:strand:- start:647 stop:1561 length:915 start_codon:yes stop_codon:yes gene_type:complete
MEKEIEEYNCVACQFTTDSKFNYNRHVKTKKHSRNTEDKSKKNICFCGKNYKFLSGLSRHKNFCPTAINMNLKIERETENEYVRNQIIDLYRETNELKETNKTLKKTLKDTKETITKLEKKNQIIKCDSNTTNNTNNTTNNNNTVNNIENKFNINVFLNEDCKNAINMSDFIKSITVTLEQLDFTKNNGLEKGLSNVIIENMSKLSLTERPVHCTDVKRETLYIKDNDVWEKDNDKSKIKKVIEKTSGKNYNAVCDWTKENPDFMDNENKQGYYTKTITTIGKPTKDIDNKIIKKICANTSLKE